MVDLSLWQTFVLTFKSSLGVPKRLPFEAPIATMWTIIQVRYSKFSIPSNTILSTVPDMNFALEKYGENSGCFEHTNDMWEQRSCKQMRQWRHWGSGCYGYRCENGRLHILVREPLFVYIFLEQINFNDAWMFSLYIIQFSSKLKHT